MSTEDEIGQGFDQAIRTAIMAGSQAVQFAAQRQQTRTMNQHREQQAAESAAREAQRRRESYRNEQVQVIYSKVNQRNFWSQHKPGQIADYAAYVALHRVDSPRAQAAFETLSKGLKDNYGVDVDALMKFDPLKFRNDLVNALDDTLATKRENAGQNAERSESAAERNALQVQAQDMERYVSALNNELGDRTVDVVKEQGWPALVTELNTAEQAGHNVENLVREITTEYDRGLSDAEDVALVLQWRAARQQTDRTPERDTEQTRDENTAPGTTAATAQEEPTWTVFDGSGSDGYGTSKITRKAVLSRIAYADPEHPSTRESMRSFAGKDATVDWAISARFPQFLSDEQRAAVDTRLTRESPADQAMRFDAAKIMARIQSEEQWVAGLSPEERKAQETEPGNPLGSLLKPIDWESPEWQQRVGAQMQSYGFDGVQAPTAPAAAGVNQNQQSQVPTQRIEPRALPPEAEAARAVSRTGFPRDVPAELAAWQKASTPRAPKRARQHVTTTERVPERER